MSFDCFAILGPNFNINTNHPTFTPCFAQTRIKHQRTDRDAACPVHCQIRGNPHCLERRPGYTDAAWGGPKLD